MLKENEVFIRKTKTYGIEKLQVVSILPHRCNKYRLVPNPNGGCLLCLVIARGKEAEKELNEQNVHIITDAHELH